MMQSLRKNVTLQKKWRYGENRNRPGSSLEDPPRTKSNPCFRKDEDRSFIAKEAKKQLHRNRSRMGSGLDGDLESASLSVRVASANSKSISGDDWSKMSNFNRGSKCYRARLEDMRIQFEERWKVVKGRDGQVDEKYHHVIEAEVDDFDFLKNLGSGAFGNVFLVRHRSTNVIYAMKVLRKNLIMDVKMVFHALEEKKILAALDFPFIVRTRYLFQDAKNLYFAMNFIPGGELYPFYKKMGCLPEEQSKFYSAQIVLALEYLQTVNILYRDLKPENILIGADGYLILVDMGFAKKKMPGRLCYTMCGTPEYLAPEVVLGKGYDEGVDWWSLGILIYELTAGFTPFSGYPEITMYQKITNNNYEIPTTFSKPLKNIVARLLHPISSKRIGNKVQRGRAKELKIHRWFSNLDFYDLFLKKIEPPFIPLVKGPTDASFYETSAPNFRPPSTFSDPYIEYFRDF